ncbi:VanW family protein [Clostridium coskatii]|uniref:Vancomycin B-type resistance protein VanW n=1 Tax=Clostridium coskatii TaxID=1705578 RepID=A0A162LAY5_9CLOT|nr:VanW family protein [Clostridium coskatii]OAA87018.1 Vancomycin B-type resistance protein VanW [Clostridium coskatii]OBR97781.1 vancomycin B-type resistance protein VanW [Clostridium coskatii]
MIQPIDRNQIIPKKRKLKRKLKINKKKMTRSLIILSILTYIIHSLWIHFLVTRYDNLIYPGVKVEGINLGGKTKDEAIDTLKRKYVNQIFKKNIIIKVQDKVYTINYSKLNIKYNLDDVVQDAFKYGKCGNIHNKYKNIKSKNGKQFNLKYSYNKKEINNTISKIENELNRAPVNASITKDEDDKFKIDLEKDGQEVDRDKLFNDIDKKISNKNMNDVYTSGTIRKVSPKIKKSSLVNINTKISSFSTNFSSSDDNRSNNIEVAAKTLNGTTIMPGEIFSFNKIVGKRTEENGYKSSKIIVGNKLQPGLGGGVCQVSTTLHNAVVRCGIVPTEREHHNIPVTYVGLGMDATVDYGHIDYKFKNTLDFPIYIECLTKNKNLVINIYSNSKLNNKIYNLINKVDKASNGKATIAKVYLVTYEDGKEISTKWINTDNYIK